MIGREGIAAGRKWLCGAFWALVLGFVLSARLASAQTIPPDNSINAPSQGSSTSISGGNGVVVTGPPSAPVISLPASLAAQILIENAGATAYVPETLSGDCSLTATGAITCTKTSGTAFGTFATQNYATPPIIGGTTPNTLIGAPVCDTKGVLNVLCPPYNAVGNGSTDDTAAIQAAVNAACGASGTHKPEVYLPATPGGLCYYTSAPILLNCSLKFNGAGWNQTSICQNYFGPTIIAQGAETGWKPPLASSITATWTASHSYSQFKEILDTNNNVEVATTGGTSGSGSHPAWPTSCPIASAPCTTTDNGVTWTFAMVGTQLASGSGSAWDAVSPEMWPGAGFGSNNATIELGNPGNLEIATNGLANFDVRFYFEEMVSTSVSGTVYMTSITEGQPSQLNSGYNDGISFYLQDGSGSCTHNCLLANVEIGGSQVTFYTTPTTGNAAPGAVHLAELSYDGTNARLFLDGNLLQTVAASGTWTIKPYSSIEIASNYPQVYPGLQASDTTATAYYDSLQISNIARNTTAYTGSVPTAKFAYDANTVALFNFPSTGVPTGTTEGISYQGKNAFIPIETSDGGADLNPLYIGNMQLSDNGIYANWMLNSTIENILINGAGRTCVHLHDNDYQDTVRRVMCVVVPYAKTNVGFLFMNQSNNNLYEHLQCDGQYTCIEQATGSGHYIMPDFSDRSYAVYPLAFIEAQAVIDSPELDIEDTAANQLAAVYSEGAYAPVIINGGQLTVGSTSAAFLAINGGAPIVDNGTDFTGYTGAPAEVLNVIGNPSSPVRIEDATWSGLGTSTPPLTNSGKSFWLVAKSGNQDLGMVFAGLPSCTAGLNGTSRFLTDGTPGGTCTGSGGGAQALCTGTTWGCGPSLLAGSLGLTTGGLFNATGGAVPTATCSGGSTGVSITAGSTNNRGQIVTSSSASTNCTITWSAASTWPQAPFCVFQDAAASITPTAVSTGACGTSTCVLDFASATSKTFNYLCF